MEVVIMGATGAVGSQTVKTLLEMEQVKKLSLLGRRPLSEINVGYVFQHKIDIIEPSSYQKHLSQHDVAICTLGIGQPSKMSKVDFLRIYKQTLN